VEDLLNQQTSLFMILMLLLNLNKTFASQDIKGSIGHVKNVDKTRNLDSRRMVN